MNKQIIIFGLMAPFFALFLALSQAYYFFDIWEYSGEPVVFEIHSGEGFSTINGRLERQGLIGSAKVFYRYCQFRGLMTKFKAGLYQIESGSTMRNTIQTLLHGKPITVGVTIPEGRNMYEVAKIFENERVISNANDFIKAAKDPQFLKQLNIKGETVEGYLYPDTYRFTPNMTPNQIIKAMVELFGQKTKNLNFGQSALTPEQVIIMASIVEKETGAKEERPVIAGVFYNRLKKRMRLQSDPTTIYGIWERYKGNIRKDDLLEQTAYNTYKISGLPKGPICNPGLDAIKAVLRPENHDFLYFVSQNDGKHVFTKTYVDHLKAVENWQINKKNREGKSWRQLNKNQ